MTRAAPYAQSNSILALAGPTAVGKTEVSLRLAEKLNGEIISVDSMQVYRGLDIGTAKPRMADRARIRHHLIDVVETTSSFDAARFLSLATNAVEDIRARGALPILCGGTGLYFKAFFEGLGEAPAGSPELRAQLEGTPLSELLRELSERDPKTFERIDRKNPRRIIRALEVIRMTGKPYSLQQSSWSRPLAGQADSPRIFGLLRSAADLRQRIDARVDAMFEQGLVSETQNLLKSGLTESRTALQALGYRQVVEYLQGRRSLPETIALVKVRTRQFAKRQLTWFRRQLPVRWIEIGPEQPIDEIVEEVSRQFSK